MSFVWGDDNIAFLKKRQQALVQNPLFYGMEYSEDQAQIKKWAPLMIEGRDPAQKIAATYMPLGTDVNHGVWTEQLMASLQKGPNFQLHLQSEVTALRQNADKTWNVTVADLAKGGQEKTVKAKFVFVGAGGAALKLLQASGIPESKNYAGFPVGGQFLAIENPELAKRHDVKAYGIASTGSPPMSVPHLDARQLDGKPVVLFGPFALATTKFLKNGSWWDLFSSVTHDNLMGMLRVGIHNLDLVQYLMQQAELTDADRQAVLAQYFPEAKREDWKLVTAGQRCTTNFDVLLYATLVTCVGVDNKPLTVLLAKFLTELAVRVFLDRCCIGCNNLCLGRYLFDLETVELVLCLNLCEV
jgi:malate dehydrogenase (quinone)